MIKTSPTYLTVLLFVAVSFNVVASKDCTCYQTSTDDFFTSYIFHDFRNIPVSTRGVPPYVARLPESADDKTGESDSPIGVLQDGLISSRQWAKDWQIQSWGKGKSSDAKYRMWNSLSNVFIANNIDGDVNATSKLVLRTKRFPEFQSAAEVENMQNNLMYASTRIRARVVGNPGAVAGLFYYRNSQNESDIEILTRDDNESVRYSNQPVVDKNGDPIPNSSTKVNINNGTYIDDIYLHDKRSLYPRKHKVIWTDWHTHRIDWTEGRSSWFVDGRHLLDKSYGVPTVSSSLILNMWSDGGVWSGAMKKGDEARLEIEWMEMVYNISTRQRPGKGRDACKAVYKVDTGNHSISGGFEAPSSATGRGGMRWLGAGSWGVMALIVIVMHT